MLERRRRGLDVVNVTPSPEPAAEPRLEKLPTALRQALQEQQLPGLGGLRALCAALVVFFHLGVPRVPGGYGVLAFFVLSGFLITWLLLHEEKRHGFISLRAFYMRRTLRIFPAFYAYWLLAVGLWWLASHRGAKPVQWPQVLAAFTYTNNYYQSIVGDPNSMLSHTWSLAVEEQFYLLWPLAFVHLRKWRVAALIAGIVIVTLHRQQLYWLHGNTEWAYEAFDGRADHLLYGCLLAVGLWQGRWSKLWHLVISQPAAILTVVALIATTQVEQSVGWFRNVVGFTVEPILTALLIAQAMASRQWPVARWLHWRAMDKLGAWSYSTYLYQQMSLGFAARVPPLLALPTGLAITYVGAALSHRLVEQPFLRLKSRFSGH